MSREIPQALRRRGIYIIRIGTSPNFTCAYIGSTTKTFNERWKRHLRKLATNVHPNPDLQSWYDTNPDLLHFDILESMRTKDKIQIENRERHWFDLLEPHIPIINRQTPRVGKTSKRGRCLRRKRKARKEAELQRAQEVQTSATDELHRIQEESNGRDPTHS